MVLIVDDESILDQLVAMSCALGDPQRDFVILGEGNTSARVDHDRMYVKASGTRLHEIAPEGFSLVHRSKVLEMLECGDLTDQQIEQGLRAAMVEPSASRHPSVETLLHSYLIGLEGVKFVAHTHPTAVNAILCSRDGKRAIMGRLYPDEIVVCGEAPAWVDYVDPGVPLGRAVRETVERHIHEYGARPNAILLQNHGLIALGGTAMQVEAITTTWVKLARIIAGTVAFGGPRHLSPENVKRICTRPDEKYRRKGITGESA